ncbi:SsgA family sporulation/cell division regulator (plasmid) [Streptomyces sp. Q6]|uniref:SsgA family sporulation/cell division regulator n=1 Tax=Streptomyces citrinus TaxID=3118173 RepID=A0ACD5AR51_9ACTN
MNQSHLSLVVTHRVTSELGLTLNCELSYDAGDPLAVSLVFTGKGPRSVRWIFSRELLAAGMNARTGDGDVVLWPVLDEDGEPDSLQMRLGGDRTALIELDAAPVAEWLAETYELVPLGTELDGVDWDALAAQLTE